MKKAIITYYAVARAISINHFIYMIHSRLKNQGFFHMATDWENYAECMLEDMNSAQGYQNLSTNNDYVPRPESRPLTKFENRGQRLGHGVWDLQFKRVD